MNDDEIRFIHEAREFLENPGFLIRISQRLAPPLARGLRFVPKKAREKIHQAVQASMEKGIEVVTKTVAVDPRSFRDAQIATQRSGLLHTAATFGTGAAGGFFGLMSLPVELPLTTAIMLRSIVAIAGEFGHDVTSREVQLECIYILSLGAKAPSGDSAYWASRLAFSDLIRQAARELEKSTAPFLVRFLAQVAARFELVVSEKALTEFVPIIGAVGGGSINAAFSDHFNRAARFHFGLRALEKRVGVDAVRAIYEAHV